MADPPGSYAFLEFNAPLSGARADRLAAALAATGPRSVLDVGCGWGELLLRIASAAPRAAAVGVDLNAALLDHARRNAADRGLADRVQFVEASAPLDGAPVDLAVCIGADHAYGRQADALAVLHRLVAPGGRVLFGTGFWEARPTAEQAAVLGMQPDSLEDLDGLVDLTIHAGFRPLRIETANRDEWETFESGYLGDWEHWLHMHPGDPGAPEIARKADEHRKGWLAGYRGVLGFAYLTLGRVRT